MRLRSLLALAVAIAIPSVTAAEAGSANVSTRQAAKCPSAARIAQLPRWKSGPQLHADVNGDGRPDAVSIRFDRKAPGLCAFYLRVATGKRAYTLKLGRLVRDLGKSQTHAPIREWPFKAPAVEAIVDLGGRGNLIALLDSQGAADDFVDFVGLSRGRFHVIRAGLDLGGAMTMVSNASCRRGGSLRHWEVWNAWTKKRPNRWAFGTDTYRRHGWRLAAVAHTRKYGSYKKMWRAAKRAGLPRKPLAGCSLARDPNFIG